MQYIPAPWLLWADNAYVYIPQAVLMFILGPNFSSFSNLSAKTDADFSFISVKIQIIDMKRHIQAYLSKSCYINRSRIHLAFEVIKMMEAAPSELDLLFYQMGCVFSLSAMTLLLRVQIFALLTLLLSP